MPTDDMIYPIILDRRRF